MALIEYQRVSTDKQNTEPQQRALEDIGCDKIYTDHAVSDTATTRDGFDEALAYLRERDTMVAWKLDRLGRNTTICNAWNNGIYIFHTNTPPACWSQ